MERNKDGSTRKKTNYFSPNIDDDSANVVGAELANEQLQHDYTLLAVGISTHDGFTDFVYKINHKNTPLPDLHPVSNVFSIVFHDFKLVNSEDNIDEVAEAMDGQNSKYKYNEWKLLHEFELADGRKKYSYGRKRVIE